MNDLQKRLKIAFTAGKSWRTRFFAAVELFCIPLSALTIFLLLAQVAGQKIWNFDLLFWLPARDILLPVLSAAAIGYVTNWLAIQMLFRPYEPKSWLPFWQQGLLPAHQEEIARSLAKMVVTRLLKPEALVAEVGAKIRSYLERPEVLEKIQQVVIELARSYGQTWARLIFKKLGGALEGILARNITPEAVYAIWDNYLAPKLQDEKLRTFFVERLTAFLQEISPKLSQEVRAALRGYLEQKLEAVPGINLFRDKIVSAVLNWADEEAINQILVDFLGKAETIEQLKKIFVQLATRVGEWIRSGEARSKIDGFSTDIKEKILAMVQEYLEENGGALVLGIFQAPELWQWVGDSGLPLLQEYLERQISENTPAIVEALELDSRVETAVRSMSARQLHEMINEMAAEHLGAIQVLGFILGAIIGALQLVAL